MTLEVEPRFEPRQMPKNAKEVFKGNTFGVWQWEQKLFDGSQATYEAIARPDYACVIGVNDEGKILMVNDEQPHRLPVLTPPGGKVEKSEDPAAAAIRELEEETGYSTDTVIPWFSYQPSARLYMTCHVFIAKYITVKQAAAPEAGERITIKWCNFDEFIALGSDQLLRDWLLRIKLLEAQLDPVKKENIRQQLYGK